jgi:glycosyltransferase involved in cell wall biosynthesis
MKARVVLDGLFTKNNALPASNNMPYSFFERYLSVFDSVTVVARCFDTEDVTAQPVEGSGVSFEALPGYNGPLGFLLNAKLLVWKILKEGLINDQAVILRLPATIPMLIGFVRLVLNKPFAVELVGDPEDAYSKEALRSRFSFFFQKLFTHGTKLLANKAVCCAYVTKNALQKKYPNVSMYSFTSLSLDASNIRTAPRVYLNPISKPKIIMVAMMQNYYKGHDIAFDAMSKLIDDYDMDFNLDLIGDGPLRSELEKLALAKGLLKYINFRGKAGSGVEVYKAMDQADLLILPSRQEGLPRVVIEAMARGLPCICSDVGGTSELVQECQLLSDSLDASSLALRIKHMCSDVKRLNSVSAINLENSLFFEASKVQLERIRFYKHLVGVYNARP